MRIFNRAHGPWFVFVVAATLFAIWIYIGNFAPQTFAPRFRPPPQFIEAPSEHRSVGGTPLGLIFGAISLGIFVFAALLGVRKKIVLWRIGNIQRWLRAHIWLTLLTVPLVLLHSGFRLGGPMTTLLMVLFAIVIVSGIYGLVLQHIMPRLMKERLPAETVYEQIPHIRAQLYVAAEKMRDSFKAGAPAKGDAGAPAPSAAKAVTAGSNPMVSTMGELSTPAARAKSVVGSTITASALSTPAATGIAEAAPRPAAAANGRAPAKTTETMSTPTARVAEGTAVPAGSEPAPASPGVPPPAPPAKPAPAPTSPRAASVSPAATPAGDEQSEAAVVEFLNQQILPYLAAGRGDRMRLGNSRYSEDLFRFVKLRVAEAYRGRVEEMQAWCDERRMLDLQLKLHHWLHGWLFVHAPLSFLLVMLAAWHAYVTLFRY
jgi:hypothetical protein